jgi:hypothetical protein
MEYGKGVWSGCVIAALVIACSIVLWSRHSDSGTDVVSPEGAIAAFTSSRNSTTVIKFDSGGRPLPPPPPKWSAYPQVSPFESVRWSDVSPEVQVRGDWYELEAVNDCPASDIVSFAQKRMGDPKHWQKHVEEDLVAIMTLMNHPPSTTVSLTLKALLNGDEHILKDIVMTRENRQALWKARDKAQDDERTLTDGSTPIAGRQALRNGATTNASNLATTKP